MMRLIDADKLIENWVFISEAEKRIINEQPTVSYISTEDLHREKEQAYYKGYEDGRKSPEPLTDAEQRIFLAAMGREEKVCKKFDKAWKLLGVGTHDECRDCREPYEDSLVKTCHEITRKVKGALWMI